MGERSRGITGAGGAFAGRGGSARRQQFQTVWVLDDTTKKLRPAQIRTGITDGRYTEVVAGDLKEGDNIVVGLVTSKVEGPGPPGSQSPMAPRGPGGRGGR
jgi:multidrug efflux pump subunit AcrA (membrane-fusion protein)